MRNALCLSPSEQLVMLGKYGTKNACLQHNLQGSHPWLYRISQVENEVAAILLEHYKEMVREYDEDAHSLEVTAEMVAQIAAEYLRVHVEKVLLLASGELLVFPAEDVTETKEVTIYGGYAKNLLTGKYERLFSTELSALLASNRAREAAIYQNKAILQLKAEYEKKGEGELWLQFLEEQSRNGNPNIGFYRLGKKYDSDDIVVQARRNLVTTVTTEWGRPSEKDIAATEDAVKVSKKNGPMPKFDIEGKE